MRGIEVTLPVIKSSKIFGKKIRRKYSEEKFTLDMSLAAEERFERKFPEVAKSIDLQQYMENVNNGGTMSRAKLLSMLKCLYCWFDTQYSFTEFLQHFDISDIDYITKLVERLKTVFGIILEEATEKN